MYARVEVSAIVFVRLESGLYFSAAGFLLFAELFALVLGFLASLRSSLSGMSLLMDAHTSKFCNAIADVVTMGREVLI